MKIYMKNKKGFTLVECVIAMAVISIITISAIGVFQAAINSSNGQWDRYISTVMADNALACFQSSDTMNDFESKLSELQADGDIIKNPEADITVSATYNELVLSGGQAVETPFTKVRAWNNKENKGGLVQFLKDDGTSVVDFKYDGEFGNTSDETVFTNQDGFYSKINDVTMEGTPKVIRFTATEDKENYTVKYENNKVSMKATQNSTPTEWEFTPFDSYLFDNNYCLVLVGDDFRSVYSAAFALYQVYDAFTKAPVTNENKESLYFYVRSDCDKYTQIKSVHYIYSSKTPSTSYTLSNKVSSGEIELTDKDGNPFSSFTWYFQGIVHPNFEKIKSTTFNSTPFSPGERIYADYTLKSNYASKIIYELKSNGKIEIYAPGDIRLYSYTGNKISDVHNKIIESCNFIKDTAYIGTSGTEKYACAQISDGIQMTSVSYDEQSKKIKFMNGATEVISFDYGTNTSAFENDKPTAKNSAYSIFYENNKIKNPDNLNISVQRIPVNSTSYSYQIALINADETQTTIFSTSYGDISTNQGASFSGIEKTKSIMIDGASYTQYFYYIPSGGNVGCYIMVTFSKVSSGDTSVEPKIKAWILSSSEITALRKDSRSDKTQNDILKRNSCYISYRKG